MPKKRAYTRSHTLMLRCCDPNKLRSPTRETIPKLAQALIRIIVDSGFTIRQGKNGRYRIQLEPFGEGCGFTFTAILSESHVGIHTYPEKKFGSSVEVSFNLCYLSADHTKSLRIAKRLFEEFFLPRNSRLEHSKRNYLIPS